MILPPFASPQDFKDALHPPEGAEGVWFIFSKDRLLVSDDGTNLPTHHDCILQRTIYLGTARNKHLFAGEVKSENKPPPGWHWNHLRSLYAVLDEENYAIAGRALQLIHWDLTNKFCGRCGNTTSPRQNERCRECTS